ncbi:MAG: chromosomal replication initiator protein DnaA [Bacilli bacterium]|jgi:chromosomal replication initiator protein|nr:chromosomal replication initiator protein DnaA [Bacilli bacterium]
MDRVELWNSCLEYLKSKTDNISFSIWFKDAELVKVQDRILVIRVPTIYIKDHINQFYTELLEEMIEKCSDVPYEYEVVIQEDLEKEEVKNEPVIIESGIDLPKFKEDNSNLNSSYTFDNFVVGDTNRFAATVGLSVAEQPGKVYNPLFIYGKSGLGKTHLMHAIGNYIKKNTQKSVLYVTSDTFISDFTNLYKKDEEKYELEQRFKDKYRNVDVLIIDDIQFLGGATKTQDEFFNTFNFLHQGQKQIIISSDRSPDDLKVLEDRLKTRFNWGITVNIMPPDYELRLKIIKNKIAGKEASALIKQEVLEFIANNCESDVRHLEGTINRLFAVTAMYSPKEINLEFAQENLKDYIGNSLYITNNIAKIQKAVAEYYDLTVENLKSKKRTANINKARQIAMYLCKMTTEETIERIGLEFNRDHATVIHACDKIDEEYKKNDELKEQVKEIKMKISN